MLPLEQRRHCKNSLPSSCLQNDVFANCKPLQAACLENVPHLTP